MGIMNSRASPQGGGWFASDNTYYRKQKWGAGKPGAETVGGYRLFGRPKRKKRAFGD